MTASIPLPGGLRRGHIVAQRRRHCQGEQQIDEKTRRYTDMGEVIDPVLLSEPTVISSERKYMIQYPIGSELSIKLRSRYPFHQLTIEQILIQG